MSATWRYIADDGVTASFGLAADEVITQRQGTAAGQPRPCSLFCTGHA